MPAMNAHHHTPPAAAAAGSASAGAAFCTTSPHCHQQAGKPQQLPAGSHLHPMHQMESTPYLQAPAARHSSVPTPPPHTQPTCVHEHVVLVHGSERALGELPERQDEGHRREGALTTCRDSQRWGQTNKAEHTQHIFCQFSQHLHGLGASAPLCTAVTANTPSGNVPGLWQQLVPHLGRLGDGAKQRMRPPPHPPSHQGALT